MSHLEALPLWAALLISALLLIGGGLALTGSIGLLRLRSFYERIHAPTLSSSWGTGATVLASMLTFTVLSSRLVLHEFLIGVFVTVTTPVTLMLLGRASLYRDRAEHRPDIPPPPRRRDDGVEGGSQDPRSGGAGVGPRSPGRAAAEPQGADQA